MERRKVEVSELLLWEDNPRVEHSSSQLDAVKNIYNFGTNARPNVAREQLMNLAASIAEEGFCYEIHPVLVLENKNKLIVKDGNRRVGALKLINDPIAYSSFLSDKHLKKLKKAKKESPTSPHLLKL